MTALRAAWSRFWPSSDLDLIAWATATLACGWGVVFLWPGDTFARAIGWVPFADVQPNDALWGGGLLALGLLQHAGRLTPAARWRRWVIALAAAWWFCVAAAFGVPTLLSTTAASTAPISHGITTLLQVWVWWRLRNRHDPV